MFANNKKNMTIMTLDQQPLTGFSDKEVSLKEGMKAWVNSQNKITNLYYMDEGKIVWISGNMNEIKIIDLAKSLALVSSPDFPYTIK